MKQIARCEFGGGLSEISLNKLIIKLIKRNIRIPAGSRKKRQSKMVAVFFVPVREPGNSLPLREVGRVSIKEYTIA